jgi:hypothetical protein
MVNITGQDNADPMVHHVLWLTQECQKNILIVQKMQFIFSRRFRKFFTISIASEIKQRFQIRKLFWKR